ncbi:hypothetical protein HLH26_13190 [Gluconacetobacter sp. 1b LMG 1731]|uniref:Uncharacterized protein n=1 Tax=Gluconacetobacter dulcium TaxID=2729096 RepID=A0A7W4IMB1_9PROT|nr:hypothetical protein [Gluconacetobacter dulcium]MBB2194609.1 hypothetical protein [Gluconacetobacter dulcium]
MLALTVLSGWRARGLCALCRGAAFQHAVALKPVVEAASGVPAGSICDIFLWNLEYAGSGMDP